MVVLSYLLSLFQIGTFTLELFGVQRENLLYICYKILNELPFYIYLFQGNHFSSGKQAFNETGVNRGFQKSLIIGCAGSWEALSSMKNLSATNSVSFPFTHYRRLTMSLKLTESTAHDFAARKKLFREMATRSARIVSGDLAVRRRSLAPVR